MKKIAFVGLGTMATPLFSSLLADGFEVCGYDLFDAPCRKFQEAGGKVVDSPASAADQSDVLISVLPYGEDVEKALLGENGVIHSKNRNVIVVECSTIDAGCAIKMHDALAEAGIRMLDGGLACSPGMARGRKGSLLLGGCLEVLDECREPLETMFQNGSVKLCGPLGCGKVMKLINNYVGGIQVVAMSEAFHMAKAAGVDLRVAHEALSAGMANCWALKIRPPYPGIVEHCPANDDYLADFSVNYEAKDMTYAIKTADQLKTSTAFGAQALQYYKTAQNWGEGGKDFSYVIRVVEALSKDQYSQK